MHGSVRGCVHTFKHEYLLDKWVDHNQILNEGWQQMAPIGLYFFLAIFDQILFKLACNNDMHESSEDFEIQPDLTTNCGVSCPGATEISPFWEKTMLSLFLSYS